MNTWMRVLPTLRRDGIVEEMMVDVPMKLEQSTAESMLSKL
jgi:hypothetical protein